IMSSQPASESHSNNGHNPLEHLAPNAPKARPDQRPVGIRLPLRPDTRAKGLENNPADIIEIEAEVRPRDADGKIIDAAPRDHQTPMIEADQQETIPPKRGPGRPPGSKNKPKLDQQQPLPGFLTE